MCPSWVALAILSRDSVVEVMLGLFQVTHSSIDLDLWESRQGGCMAERERGGKKSTEKAEELTFTDNTVLAGEEMDEQGQL